MYNETIKAENKIISCNALMEIFQAMNETLKKYQQISEKEKMANAVLDYSNQHYTFKDEGSRLRIVVDFHDNTCVTFDNYENFISVFYNRANEVKSMDIDYKLSYSVINPEPNRSTDYYSQAINMHINEKKIDIQVNLRSDDHKLDDIYNLIKEKILKAPERYTRLIKKRNAIKNKIIFGFGFIPAIIVAIMLCFIPVVLEVYKTTYILFALASCGLAYLFGSVVMSGKLDNLYSSIVPEQVYEKYDYENNRSIYTDNVDDYISKSEVLIGKNFYNMQRRNEIKKLEKKYKKFLPYELIVIIVISLIIIVI